MLVGENDAIARDFMKHYRSGIPHAVEPSYAVLRGFDAMRWPTYILADAGGKVVLQNVGMGAGGSDLWRFRKALEGVVRDAKPDAGRAAPPSERVVCKNGICTVATGPSGKTTPRDLSPRLAAAPDGALWMAWCSMRDGDANVYLRRQAPGAPQADLAVTRSLADDYDPCVAVGPDGRVWVAWVSNRSGKYDIYLRVRDGATWSPEMRVTRSDDDAMGPDVTVDPEGRVWVTYYRWNRAFGTSRDRDVFVRWLKGQRWSPEMRVSPADPAIEDHTDPVVAADPSRPGRVWIAWSYDYHPSLSKSPEDTDQPSIFARPVDPDGMAGDAIHLVGTRGAGLHAVDLWPSLGFDAKGALWCAYDFAPLVQGGRGALVASWDGKGFGTPDRVARTSDPFESPCLVVARDGSKVLVWSEKSGDRWGIRGAREAGTGWSDPRNLLEGEGDLRAPSAVAAGGAVWIACEEQTGVESRIRVERVRF